MTKLYLHKSMSSKFDLRNVLRHPIVYTTYQKLVGGYRARRLFIENHVPITPGQKLLDIGCGPADLLDFLPKVDYTGIDHDADYIAQAKKKYGDKGTFICADVDELKLSANEHFDFIIAAGVLHHLDDAQCLHLFDTLSKVLKPGGRFVSMDGCFIPNQNKISEYFLKKDRGEFVRTQQAYEVLANKGFDNVEVTIDESYFKIPYTSIILSCH